MPLFLRKVDPGREAYRVILKDEDGETEIGSIGPQHTVGAETRWVWGIDTVIPLREADQTGYGADRKACVKRLKLKRALLIRFGVSTCVRFSPASCTRVGTTVWNAGS